MDKYNSIQNSNSVDNRQYIDIHCPVTGYAQGHHSCLSATFSTFISASLLKRGLTVFIKEFAPFGANNSLLM